MPKRFSVITTLIVIFLSSPAHGDQTPPPGYTKADSGRVDIGPALQLPLNMMAPLICSTPTQGTLALNDHAQLCLCAEESWKLVNSDEPCTWTPRLPNPPTAPASDRPQIITDDKENAVLVLIHGNEVLRIDGRGVHVKGDIDYTGVLADVSAPDVVRPSEPVSQPKKNSGP